MSVCLLKNGFKVFSSETNLEKLTKKSLFDKKKFLELTAKKHLGKIGFFIVHHIHYSTLIKITVGSPIIMVGNAHLFH